MLPKTKEEALRRLNYIEGHLQGVRRMVDEEEYCVDILKQLYAVRKALDKLGGILLEGHLNTCVIEGIRDSRQKEVVQELLDLYTLANK